MGDTKIQWTGKVWNVTRGCKPKSPGCANCYAAKMGHRFSGPGRAYEGLTKRRLNGLGATWTGEVAFDEKQLLKPLSWRKPCKVFVNSQSDLFYDGFSFEQIDRVFAVMRACQRHTFQLLTKYSERMVAWFEGAEERVAKASQQLAQQRGWSHVDKWTWPLKNLWLGVSVESKPYAIKRIPHLRSVPAAVRFISFEPLLESIDLALVQMSKHGANALHDIHLAIVGGESGQHARPFELEWARQIRDMCNASGSSFFFKQAGRLPLDKGSPIRLESSKGDDMNEWPEDLRIRQFPQ